MRRAFTGDTRDLYIAEYVAWRGRIAHEFSEVAVAYSSAIVGQESAMSFLVPGFFIASVAVAAAIIAVHFIVTRQPTLTPSRGADAWTRHWVPKLPEFIHTGDPREFYEPVDYKNER